MPAFSKIPQVHHKHLIMIAVIVIVVLAAAVLVVWLIAPDLIASIGSSFNLLIAPSFSFLGGGENLVPSSSPFANAEDRANPFEITNPFEYKNPFG